MKIDLAFLFKSLLIAFIGFITPIQYLLLGVGALIAIDTICGVYRAYKLNQDITSKKFGHIVSKLLLYNLAVISGYIVQLMVGVDILPIAKIISVAIALTELKSITENVNEMTGIDLWKFVSNYMKRQNDDVSKTMTESQTVPKD